MSKIIAGYDLDSRRVVLPEHIRRMSFDLQQAWAKRHGIILVPSVEGGVYSMFEMLQPWAPGDGPTLTAASEALLTQDAFLTLGPNAFSVQGKEYWFHAMGKISNAATPGTWTFRLRYGGLAGTIIATTGAVTPNASAVTDNLWFLDLWVKAVTIGPTTTSLVLLSHGRLELANSSGAAADIRAQSMPPSGTALANVGSLDGTISKALSLTAQPSLGTGSITCRDVTVVAMN